MMFSPESEAKLANLEPDLVRVLRRALGYGIMDFTVIQTLRTAEEEAQKVAQGLSETQNSKHLAGPDGKARAADVAPVPLDWNDTLAFCQLAGAIKAAAKEEDVAIIWGGDWRTLKDRDHFELANPQVAGV